MKLFIKHITIYIITILVLFLSVGVNIVKCSNKNKICSVVKTKPCKKKVTYCNKTIEKNRCEQKREVTCKTQDKNCGQKTTIHLQFDFETITSKINIVDKCKELALFNQINQVLNNLIPIKHKTKYTIFSDELLLNKPIISEIQVFRL